MQHCEDDICVKYYFKNVHIDLTHHYEMVDNYGLSAIFAICKTF